MSLPAAFAIEGPDGQSQTLLKKGAQLPAQARAVFATQKAGQRDLKFKLWEGEGKGGKLIGSVDVELPPGLPPNTWMNIFITVQPDLSIAIEVKENLRRIRIDAEIERAGATAEHFK